MKNQSQFAIPGLDEVETSVTGTALDLVIPVTTPDLTRAALAAANRMGAGLNATLRLIKIQVVPFPMDLHQSPVYLDFLRSQLVRYESELPIAAEIRLSRELEPGLVGTLTRNSIVVLATGKRLWRTRTEGLAAVLRKEGYRVVVVQNA
ncbi:MAG TPA: hypothetical protein VG297_24055 [Bryobacteraceae bacterium]|jgi:hypothetical protein|nr:hypothetical protein [Bryobacteraceae bacterium]